MQRRAVFGLFLLPLARGQGTCAPTPALTQGPYYLRDVPQREDLREGLPGVPLRLLLRVRDRACRPLQGARVDLWHTDALGRYSGVNAPGTFCRGWQATDERGEVAFLTLFPGWYPSRTPHLHLRVEAGGRVFATQLFFPEEVQRQVYALPPYRERGRTFSSAWNGKGRRTGGPSSSPCPAEATLGPRRPRQQVHRKPQ